MAGFQSQVDAQAQADKEAEMKRRAARQAAEKAAVPVPEKLVSVRVLKMGHDKISTGFHAAGLGDAFYEKGERFDIAEDVALALEARGFVEIEDEVQQELLTKDVAGKGKDA